MEYQNHVVIQERICYTIKDTLRSGYSTKIYFTEIECMYVCISIPLLSAQTFWHQSYTSGIRTTLKVS